MEYVKKERERERERRTDTDRHRNSAEWKLFIESTQNNNTYLTPTPREKCWPIECFIQNGVIDSYRVEYVPKHVLLPCELMYRCNEKQMGVRDDR